MGLTKNQISVQEGLQKYDGPARDAVRKTLPLVWSDIKFLGEHPDKFSADLIAYAENGKPMAYVEVECSTIWKTHDFPFKKLNYLEERKGRYLYERPYTDLEFVFVMFNKDFTKMAVVNRRNILESPVEEMVSSWKGKEKFRRIDLDRVCFCDVL